MDEGDKSHFVSEFLTRPWQKNPDKKKGELLFYDFQTHEFAWEKSGNLLQKPGLNTKKLERFLSDYIESPLGQATRALKKGEKTALDDPKEKRALYLLHFLQGLRGASVTDEEARDRLHLWADKSEAQINEGVAWVQDQFKLMLLPTPVTPEGRPQLCYPAQGYFTFYLYEPRLLTGRIRRWAIPLDLHVAMALIPQAANCKSQLNDLRGRLQYLSIGLPTSTRVVVPPDVCEERKEFGKFLQEMRALNTEYFKLEWEREEAIRKAFEAGGLRVAEHPYGGLHLPDNKEAMKAIVADNYRIQNED